jgi:hypothetical protein
MTSGPNGTVSASALTQNLDPGPALQFEKPNADPQH